MTFSVFRYLGALNRGVIIGIELMAVVILIIAALGGYMLFLLSRGPVELDRLRPYIEQSLSGGQGELQFKVATARASWPGLKGALMLDLSGIEVWQGGQKLVAVDDLSIGVAKAPLLIGRIRPERLIVRDPVLMLERDADRSVRLALSGPVKNPQDASLGTSNITQQIINMIFAPEREDRNFGVFSYINEIEIRSARVRISDAVLGMTWQINDVSLFFREVDVGVYGSVSMMLPGNQMFSTVMTYHRERDFLSINSQFQNFHLASLVGRLVGLDLLRHQRLPLSGTVAIETSVRNPVLDRLVIKATTPSGTIQFPGVLPEALPIENAALDLEYQRSLGQLVLKGFDFIARDIPVTISAAMAAKANTDYHGDMVIRVPKMDLEDLAAFWPEGERDTPLAHWLLKRLRGGVFTDMQVTVPLRIDHADRQLTMLALRPKASFTFDHLFAQYHDTLYPVEDGGGTGVIENDALRLQVNKGHIKDLQIADTDIEINDLTKEGAGHATIVARFTGPLATVLDYIALKPINLGGQIPVKGGRVKGNGSYTAVVSFPTVRDLPADQVDVDVDATLTGVLLPGLVKGLDLSGGPFDLKVKDGHIAMKGAGTLDTRTITLDWQQPVRAPAKGVAMQVIATVNSDDDLRRKFGADLAFLQGPAEADVSYREYAEGYEDLTIKANLKPTRLLLENLYYEKAPGLAATASLDLRIKGGQVQSGSNLMVDAPRLQVKRGKLEFGSVDGAFNLTGASIPDFVLGDSVGSVSYRRSDQQMVIEFKGPKIDLKPFLRDTKEAGAGPRVQFSAQADAIDLDGDQPLRNGDLTIALGGTGDLQRINMTGQAGSKGVVLRYAPDENGKMNLFLDAQDAGGFLQTLGIYSNMVGGTLSLTGTPVGTNNRDVKGKLTIRDFSVIKAPVLAQLISGLSITGVAEQLGNKGIGFSRLESDFSWVRRGAMDLMTFKEGRTSGSALGLTFDGQYDRGKKTVEITGTIIPMSGLNTFASKIPLIGQIITGGDGSALFAATYSIKGAAANPQTLINPLSVLTPGIIRRILFESSTSDPADAKPARTQKLN